MNEVTVAFHGSSQTGGSTTRSLSNRETTFAVMITRRVSAGAVTNMLVLPILRLCREGQMEEDAEPKKLCFVIGRD
jgi:hypothetical protein